MSKHKKARLLQQSGQSFKRTTQSNLSISDQSQLSIVLSPVQSIEFNNKRGLACTQIGMNIKYPLYTSIYIRTQGEPLSRLWIERLTKTYPLLEGYEIKSLASDNKETFYEYIFSMEGYKGGAL